MVLSDKIFKTVLENITPKKPPVLLDGWNPASPKRNNTSKSWEIAWMKYLSTGQPNFSHHQYQWRNWCHQKISFLPATVAQHLHTQRTSWQVLKLSGSENKKTTTSTLLILEIYSTKIMRFHHPLWHCLAHPWPEAASSHLAAKMFW